MIAKEMSFSSAEENIRCDEILLASAEEGSLGEVLRFWESREFFIVAGRASRIELEVRQEAAAADGVKIIRRRSGGSAILEGPGCLNYSLVLSLEKTPALKDIRGSYRIILGGISKAFNEIGVRAVFEPLSDMALSGRKFSGNAQWRRRRYMLHHGTILYDFPIERVERYINMPPVCPPYREGRSHSEFLINLGISRDKIMKAIEAIWMELSY